MRGDYQGLKEKRFRLDTRSSFISEGTVKHQRRLLRQIVRTQSLDISRKRLDTDMNNLD